MCEQVAVKNTEVNFMSFCSWKFVPTTISGDVDIPEVPRFLQKSEFSLKFTKITSRISLYIHSLFFLIFTPIFDSLKWLYYQTYVNQKTLNHIIF